MHAKFTSSENKPPIVWPSDGRIQFDDMSLRYNDGDEQPILKTITCTIKAGEMVSNFGI